MIEELYERYLQSHVVTTDSRQVTPGCIFFALKGDNFDGNAFVPQALAQGAAACVTSDAQYGADQRCYVVPDVLKALQELAHCHRRHLTNQEFAGAFQAPFFLRLMYLYPHPQFC